MVFILEGSIDMKKLSLENVNQHMIDTNTDSVEIELGNDFPSYMTHYKDKYWVISPLIAIDSAFDNYGKCDPLVEVLVAIFNTSITHNDFLGLDPDNNIALQRFFDTSIDIKKSPDFAKETIYQHKAYAQYLYGILNGTEQNTKQSNPNNKAKVVMP